MKEKRELFAFIFSIFFMLLIVFPLGLPDRMVYIKKDMSIYQEWYYYYGFVIVVGLMGSSWVGLYRIGELIFNYFFIHD